jgi:hypothetical protein
VAEPFEPSGLTPAGQGSAPMPPPVPPLGARLGPPPVPPLGAPLGPPPVPPLGARPGPPPVPTPVPLPLYPVPVTGVETGRRSHRRFWTALAIVLAVLVVVGAFSTAVYLVAGSLTTSVRRSATVTAGDLGAPGDVPAAIAAAFEKRAKIDYPGTTFVAVDSLVNTGTPDAPGPEQDVYVTLADPRFGGFRFVVVYTGSVTATDPAAFDNTDDFFLPADSTSQPAASFKTMWMRTHAADTCDYVIESGDSYAATRTYEVGFTSNAGEALGEQPSTAYFIYTVATVTWTETKTDPSVDDSSADPSEGSAPDTATAVAKAFPGFELQGVAQEPDGPWDEIIRSRTYHKVRLGVSIEYLTPNDPSDTMQELLVRNPARARAFMAVWTSRHPATIIEMVDFDPDGTGDTRLIDVTYSPGSSAAFGVDLRDARFRYSPSNHTWVSVK